MRESEKEGCCELLRENKIMLCVSGESSRFFSSWKLCAQSVGGGAADLFHPANNTAKPAKPAKI